MQTRQNGTQAKPLLDNDVLESEFNSVLLYCIVYKRKQKRREHDVQERQEQSWS